MLELADKYNKAVNYIPYVQKAKTWKIDKRSK